MSDVQFPAVAAVPETAPLTQVQRVIYTFTAPSKTFNDIKRNTSWWLPFLLTVVFGYALFAGITTKVTWQQVAENNIKMSPKQAEQMEKQPADQRASSMKIAALFTEGIFAALPVIALIMTAIMAGVLLATVNFGFGGKATFWQAFAVVWFAGLPGLIKFLLGTIALFAGLAPESFNINNFAGTNVGYYLPPETSKPLMALATSLDATTIWTLVLCSIGISIVAGTKRSAGYIAVFGWWALLVLFGVGMAAAFA
jgi:hypothetical protein